MTAADPSPRKAAAWMAGWLTAMVVMAVAGRAATRTLHVFQIMEMRSLIGFVLLWPLIHANGGVRALRTARPGQQVVRNAVHYAAQFGWFFALTLIPIAQVVAIEFTMPIWTALLAVSFLGERLNAARVVAVALGVVGVAVIVRPGVDQVDPGQLIALAAAVGFAVSVILVKSLTRTDSAVTIVFWMLVVQSAIGAVPALIVWRTPTAAVWPWVLVIALCGAYSQFCMTQALRHAEATMIVPMDFLRVPLSAVAGWLAFGERIDAFTIGGAALILSANLLNLRRPAPVPNGQQMATHP
jgi:drug/metabolite transporter (DMT)-like permease